MKKSELKNIIKECIREVIFEDGVLSNIVSEVAQGLQGSQNLHETRTSQHSVSTKLNSSAHQQVRQKMLNAVGGDAYKDIRSKMPNPELFAGTKPIQESRSGKGGALAGVAPNDPGIDLSQLPGMGNWAAVAAGKR